MAMVINSNIQSLNAQRHLNNSLDAQNTATERLSSGLRINSAKDDAAGLAIANRMTSQVQGLNQAVRNANDGAALIQTAEGGLEEVTNILQRMRELSIQSANGTYDTGNRDTLNAEVDQLQQEIDRIGETTSFNGLNILDGSGEGIDLQVGENANQTIALSINKVSTDTLGSGTGADIVGEEIAGALLTALTTITATGATDSGTKINGIELDIASAGTAGLTLEDALSDINSKLDGSVIADSLVEINASSKGDGILTGAELLTVTVTNNDATTSIYQIQNTTSLDNLVDQFNEAAGGDSVKAELDSDGNLLVSGAGVASIELAVTGGAAVPATVLGTDATALHNARLTLAEGTTTQGITVDYGTSSGTYAAAVGIDARLSPGSITSGTAAVPAGDIVEGGVIINGVKLDAYDSTVEYDKGSSNTVNEANDLAAWMNLQSDETGVVASANTSSMLVLNSVDGKEISLDYAGSDATAAVTKGIIGLQETNDADSSGSNVASIDISTAEGAQKAIGILDDAIKQVSETRGDLGAISNRLDYTTRNLSNISENAASARSQIMDADFAAESANLSRAQVLQQAGNAMLAQANSRPQQVLSLLQ